MKRHSEEIKTGDCQEKRRLTDEFSRAAAGYSTAAKALKAALRGDLNPALKDIQGASLEFANSRRALREHITKHRC